MAPWCSSPTTGACCASARTRSGWWPTDRSRRFPKALTTGWRVQELRGEGRSEPRLAVGTLGHRGLGLLPTSTPRAVPTAAQRAVRRTRPRHGARLRPLQRLQEAGAAAQGPDRPCILLVAAVGRDVIDCAAGQPHLAGWCRAWLERIAAIYRLNKVRLSHYDPALAVPGRRVRHRAQVALEAALEGLFARASSGTCSATRRPRWRRGCGCASAPNPPGPTVPGGAT